jgi:hypothetical protein
MRLDNRRRIELNAATMKTLIPTLAVLTLSFTTLVAKEGAFTSVILTDPKNPLQLQLGAHQWIKITNFVQNNGDIQNAPSGVAVFKGDVGMWVLFASDPSASQSPVIVTGPAIVNVIPAMGANVTTFLTYQRGSD